MEIMKESALNQAEVAHKLNIVSARAEALSIFVNMINSVLTVMQASETPVHSDIIAALQSAINSENEITNQILQSLEQAVNQGPIAETQLDSAEFQSDSEISEVSIDGGEDDRN